MERILTCAAGKVEEAGRLRKDLAFSRACSENRTGKHQRDSFPATAQEADHAAFDWAATQHHESFRPAATNALSVKVPATRHPALIEFAAVVKFPVQFFQVAIPLVRAIGDLAAEL